MCHGATFSFINYIPIIDIGSADNLHKVGFKIEKGEFVLKDVICAACGAIGGFISWLFGGWDAAVITLLIFMGIDYLSGLAVAGVFHASKKTDSGTLESRAGWKGLTKKAMTLLFVLIAYRLDLLIGTTYIRDAVVIAFVTNELISIVENAGLMGIPLPAVITNAIDILKRKGDNDGN